MTTAVASFFKVIQADYVDGLRLRVSFDDGAVRVIDFEPFLAAARHPNIRKYLDKRRFKNFSIDRGHLHWNDYDLIFPIADLYAGEIR